MSFEAWLQSRLVTHGYKIAVDGAIGGETTRALIAFQRQRKIRQTGVADPATVAALRADPGNPKAATAEPPAETLPPWMAEARRRMGLNERRDNALLAAFLKLGKYLGDPAKLPWCGDFVETCIVKTMPGAVVPNNPFWAQGWKDFGIDAGGPKVGSVGVIRWNATSGHVGFVAAYDAARRRVLLLGGNQSDSVNLTWFPLDKFIAFRWPEIYPVRAFPPLADGASTHGTAAGTR